MLAKCTCVAGLNSRIFLTPYATPPVCAKHPMHCWLPHLCNIPPVQHTQTHITPMSTNPTCTTTRMGTTSSSPSSHAHQLTHVHQEPQNWGRWKKICHIWTMACGEYQFLLLAPFFCGEKLSQSINLAWMEEETNTKEVTSHVMVVIRVRQAH